MFPEEAKEGSSFMAFMTLSAILAYSRKVWRHLKRWKIERAPILSMTSLYHKNETISAFIYLQGDKSLPGQKMQEFWPQGQCQENDSWSFGKCFPRILFGAEVTLGLVKQDVITTLVGQCYDLNRTLHLPIREGHHRRQHTSPLRTSHTRQLTSLWG